MLEVNKNLLLKKIKWSLIIKHSVGKPWADLCEKTVQMPKENTLVSRTTKRKKKQKVCVH